MSGTESFLKSGANGPCEAEDKDELLLQEFEQCTLDPGRFHHNDHVHIAWLYLQRYPVLDALTRFATSLRNFAASLGKHNLYHATITWGYLLLIHERINRRPSLSWDEFSAANPDLMNWKNSILKDYYSEKTLASELSRKIFLFPDRIPVKDNVEPEG